MAISVARANVRIVLINPSHPGNIGAAARAMKTMGLTQLCLVNPEAFPHDYATARAAGATDILESAIVTEDLQSAIGECEWIFGTSARSRALPWPVKNPRESAELMASKADSKIAVLFGPESKGLSNDDLAICHYHIHIPTEENFSSLNLAAAVQVVAYELKMAMLGKKFELESGKAENIELANAQQMQGFYQHLEQVMVNVKFLNPKHPKLLMRRLQRLFNRSHLEVTELNILRGLLSAIDRVTQ